MAKHELKLLEKEVTSYFFWELAAILVCVRFFSQKKREIKDKNTIDLILAFYPVINEILLLHLYKVNTKLCQFIYTRPILTDLYKIYKPL